VAVAGGGRIRMEDKIDPAVGFTAEVKLGDEVKAGDVLGILYVRENKKAHEALERIKQAYTIAEEPPQSGVKLIKEVIAE
jgi:thymidine phosphorylase